MTSQLPQTTTLPIQLRYGSAAGESAATGAPATAQEPSAQAEAAGMPFAELLEPRQEASGPTSPPSAGSAAPGKPLPQSGSSPPFGEGAGPGAPLAAFYLQDRVVGGPIPGAAALTAAAGSAEVAGAPTTTESAPLAPAGPGRDGAPGVDGRRAADALPARQPTANMPFDAGLAVADGEAVFVTRETPPAALAGGPSRNRHEASIAAGPSRADSAVRPDGPSQWSSTAVLPGLPQRLPGLAGDLPHNALNVPSPDGRANTVLPGPEAATSAPPRADGPGRTSATPAPVLVTSTATDETLVAPLPAGGNTARDLERLAGAPGRAAADVAVSRRSDVAAGSVTPAAAEAPGDAGERPTTRFENFLAAGQRTATMAVTGEETAAAVDDLPGRTVKAELAEPRLMSEVRPDRVLTVAPSFAPSVQGPSTGVTTQSVAAMPTLIDTPVADPAWGEAVGKRVSMLLSRNVGSAELRLSPAELGPLQVQIAVDDNVARVTFTAAHAVTRDALEQALPRLREMLADQGISLADAGVSDQRGETAEDGADSAPADFRAADVEADPDRSGQPSPRSVEPLPPGRLDTYA